MKPTKATAAIAQAQNVIESMVAGPGTALMEPPVEAAPRGHAIALMGKQAFMAVVEARPEIKDALKGYDVAFRRLGEGDPRPLQLSNDEITADTLLIGFSIPTNLVVRAKKGIEIPVGRTINRTEMSNKTLDEPKVAALIKALAETGRIALRAYSCKVEPLIDHQPESAEDAAEEEAIQF